MKKEDTNLSNTLKMTFVISDLQLALLRIRVGWFCYKHNNGHIVNNIHFGSYNVFGHNPGNVPPPSKPEDSIFCKTIKSYGMNVNITILLMYNQCNKTKLVFIPLFL